MPIRKQRHFHDNRLKTKQVVPQTKYNLFVQLFLDHQKTKHVYKTIFIFWTTKLICIYLYLYLSIYLSISLSLLLFGDGQPSLYFINHQIFLTLVDGPPSYFIFWTTRKYYIYLSFHLCIYLSIFIYIYIYLYLSMYLSTYLYIYIYRQILCICQSIYRYLYRSSNYIYIYFCKTLFLQLFEQTRIIHKEASVTLQVSLKRCQQYGNKNKSMN